MGLDVNGTQFLLYARARGVNFARTAMLGRQGLHLSAGELRRNLVRHGDAISLADARRLLTCSDGYAEPLLERLGAGAADSFDVSPVEGANCLHDFNAPIPDCWKGHYTCVLDGGSLEHIFHFPTAIKNCMEMVTVGGHFLGITPANNFAGHGFYQFSPELYFRLFDAEQGFCLEEMLLLEKRPRPRWYAVTDPAVLGRRVTLTGRRPTYLLILARKVADRPILARPPLQSDYVPVWHGRTTPPGYRRWRHSRRRWLLAPVRCLARAWKALVDLVPPVRRPHGCRRLSPLHRLGPPASSAVIAVRVGVPQPGAQRETLPRPGQPSPPLRSRG